ncbi:hypothetical protein BDV19DRAFT_353672 [Aspergillus venezuelensis]
MTWPDHVLTTLYSSLLIQSFTQSQSQPSGTAFRPRPSLYSVTDITARPRLHQSSTSKGKLQCIQYSIISRGFQMTLTYRLQP